MRREELSEVARERRIRDRAGAAHGAATLPPCAGLSRGRYELSLVRWRRQKVSAPTALAIATAISDLFGRPSSTVGVALLALRLTKRFPSFQTPQPMTALRRLTIDTPGVVAATSRSCRAGRAAARRPCRRQPCPCPCRA